MSYSIYLRGEKCPTCHRAPVDEPECPEPTYNLTQIFDLALTGEPFPNADTGEGAVVLLGAKTDRPRGLRLLNGRKARNTVDDLCRALARLDDPQLRAKFIHLEPANKWGTLEGAIEVMKKLRTLAETYPDNTWSVC